MNLYLRLFFVLLANIGKHKLHYMDRTDTCFRVLPHDLDAFGHMNNGRYLQIMDVARTHWMARTGVVASIRKHNWGPILGGVYIRYRFSLRFFQAYRVSTRLLCWDQRWFYLEHCFIDRRERHVAIGVTRAAMRAESKWVSAARIAEEIHPGATSPEMPAFLQRWLSVEDEMFQNGTAKHPTLSNVRRAS